MATLDLYREKRTETITPVSIYRNGIGERKLAQLLGVYSAWVRNAAFIKCTTSWLVGSVIRVSLKVV